MIYTTAARSAITLKAKGAVVWLFRLMNDGCVITLLVAEKWWQEKDFLLIFLFAFLRRLSD